MKTIMVIGFGKIGQAVAANMLRHGCGVLAIDIDVSLNGQFLSGSFFTNEPGVGTVLSDAHRDGRLTIDVSPKQRAIDAAVICIPLGVDMLKHSIDAPFIECFKSLIPYCSNKFLVVVETSVPVGYMRTVLLPVLEAEGKEHGRDFLLSYSPERIKSGTMLRQLETVPKVIGGITREATEANHALYSLFFKPEILHCVASIESAEMMKLAGMIYRDVNIALANQLAMFAQLSGIDLPSLLPLINADGEAQLLQPGIGVGGHCTPVYPYFLIDNFRSAGLDFSLASEGRKVNDAMVAFAYSLVKEKLTRKKALVLGLSFRPDIKEDSNSVGLALYRHLQRDGIAVAIHDTEYTEDELVAKQLEFDDPATTDAEVIFLVTMHRRYRFLDFVQLYTNGVRFIVDGRNQLPAADIIRAGIQYTGIGNGKDHSV